MSNVLPPERKRIEQSLVKARFVRTFGWVVFVGALVALIALAPSYISVRMARTALESALSEPESSEAAKADALTASAAQNILSAVKPVITATSSPSSALSSALRVKPDGISIRGMAYTKGMLTLSGTGESREIINAYRDALDQDPIFTSVVIPVAALVGAQEGKLTITLRGEF